MESKSGFLRSDRVMAWEGGKLMDGNNCSSISSLHVCGGGGRRQAVDRLRGDTVKETRELELIGLMLELL